MRERGKEKESERGEKRGRERRKERKGGCRMSEKEGKRK